MLLPRSQALSGPTGSPCHFNQREGKRACKACGRAAPSKPMALAGFKPPRRDEMGWKWVCLSVHVSVCGHSCVCTYKCSLGSGWMITAWQGKGKAVSCSQLVLLANSLFWSFLPSFLHHKIAALLQAWTSVHGVHIFWIVRGARHQKDQRWNKKVSRSLLKQNKTVIPSENYWDKLLLLSEAVFPILFSFLFLFPSYFFPIPIPS